MSRRSFTSSLPEMPIRRAKSAIARYSLFPANFAYFRYFSRVFCCFLPETRRRRKTTSMIAKKVSTIARMAIAGAEWVTAAVINRPIKVRPVRTPLPMVPIMPKIVFSLPALRFVNGLKKGVRCASFRRRSSSICACLCRISSRDWAWCVRTQRSVIVSPPMPLMLALRGSRGPLPLPPFPPLLPALRVPRKDVLVGGGVVRCVCR